MNRIKAPRIRKRRQTLTMQVFGILKDAIKMGKLRPNEKLVESQLTSGLGISRTPLREALYRLEIEGYVTRFPSGGYAVVDFTLQRVRELCELWQALEGYAAFLACKRATTKQIEALEQIQEKITKAYEAEDVNSLNKLNWEFHAQLCSACANEQLVVRVEALRSYFYRRDVLKLLSLNEWRESAAEHQLLINAIKKHECEGISEIMHQHIQRRADFYAKHLVLWEAEA